MINRNIGDKQHFSRKNEPDFFVEVMQQSPNVKALYICELPKTLRLPPILSMENMEKILVWAKNEPVESTEDRLEKERHHKFCTVHIKGECKTCRQYGFYET